MLVRKSGNFAGKNSLGLGWNPFDSLWDNDDLGTDEEEAIRQALLQEERAKAAAAAAAAAAKKPAPSGGGGGYVAPTPAAPPPLPVESSGLSGLQMAAIGLGGVAVLAVIWKIKNKGGFSRNSHDEDCYLDVPPTPRTWGAWRGRVPVRVFLRRQPVPAGRLRLHHLGGPAGEAQRLGVVRLHPPAVALREAWDHQDASLDAACDAVELRGALHDARGPRQDRRLRGVLLLRRGRPLRQRRRLRLPWQLPRREAQGPGPAAGAAPRGAAAHAAGAQRFLQAEVRRQLGGGDVPGRVGVQRLQRRRDHGPHGRRLLVRPRQGPLDHGRHQLPLRPEAQPAAGSSPGGAGQHGQGVLRGRRGARHPGPGRDAGGQPRRPGLIYWDIMSVPITQRLLATPAFTSSMVLGKVMGDVDPLWSLQSKIDGIALIKSDVELRLAKYMTRVEMDAASASKAMREMASWSNDFGQQVSALPLNSEMPEEMRPKLPTDQARNWVAAVFFDGVYGFQFYQSGAVRRKINEGSMTVEQAESDLEARRKSFQIITAMDEAGDLARIFASKAVGDGGISIGAAIIVVAVIAVIGVLIYQHKENAANRSEVLARFDKMCEEANKNKDTSKAAAKEHEKCIDEVKPPKPAKDPIELALYMLGGVLGVYVIGYYVVPRLIAHRGVRLQVADLLSTLTPDTREKVEQLLAEAQAQYGYNLKVVSARRGCDEQAKLYAQGRTAPGKVVTNAQGCKSWHVLGRAVDIAFVSPNPSTQDWDNLGAIAEAMGFTWGKRFSGTLNDLPHFEWHPGMKIEDVCHNPSDCDGGVAASMGQGGAAGEPAWPYVVVSVAAAAMTWVLLG